MEMVKSPIYTCSCSCVHIEFSRAIYYPLLLKPFCEVCGSVFYLFFYCEVFLYHTYVHTNRIIINSITQTLIFFLWTCYNNYNSWNKGCLKIWIGFSPLLWSLKQFWVRLNCTESEEQGVDVFEFEFGGVKKWQPHSLVRKRTYSLVSKRNRLKKMEFFYRWH